MYLTNSRLAALAAMTVSFASCAAGAWAAAQDYPHKPIRFLVGLAPGGGVDFTARTISAKLSTAIGQQVIVDNRAGAGGSIAANIAAKSAPDGYTMLMGSRSNFVVDALINKSLGYDPRRDLAPVTLATSQSMVLIVNLSAILPELPTIAESGLPGFEADNWYGIAVPAKTQRAIVHRLNQEIVAVLNLPEVRQALFNQGLEAAPGTPDAFAAHIKADHDKWSRIGFSVVSLSWIKESAWASH